MKPKILALALALGAFSANAGTFNVEDFVLDSTQDLVDVCGAPASDPLYQEAKIFCIGYIAAAIDYHDEIAKAPDLGPVACAETEVTRNDVIGVFLEWSAKNPQHMKAPPVESLLRAAAEKWPCK